MKSRLRQALDYIRENSSNDRELGLGFESLIKIYLENDPTQIQEYSKVWTYEEWAKKHEGYSKKDIGIDLVAKLKDGSGYCAVQCKFYDPIHQISKSDLDSFISASATNDFTRLILADTSTQSLGNNAQKVFDKLNKEYIRIQLAELEESRIDWLAYAKDKEVNFSSKKELLDHQIRALSAVKKGFQTNDRGKLIMACGTGKTFTALKIAETLAGKGKLVLYMVPSLALMSQTIREWKNDSDEDFTAFAACSDKKVGRRKAQDDVININLHDLAFPATTDPVHLANKLKTTDKEKMIVVFSTYQSIEVIAKAQLEHKVPDFDLIICDEAHRTTGATLAGDDESTFVQIHNNNNIAGKKRLYMTATPRIYGETAKKKAEEGEVVLASMDDEDFFGKVFFHRGFGWAVENNLLSDYKVIVLAVDEGLVSRNAQQSLSEGAELSLDDATKIMGCYKALAKVGISTGEGTNDLDAKHHMRRALAFCQNIKASELFASEFKRVVDDYSKNETVRKEHKTELYVELKHVDGTFNADQRNDCLAWLRDYPYENECRVLTNAKCLSEGVDVPSLDAIMFLHPRKSQIDVVQSVGRVMRKADTEGKELGYVILPIAVPAGVTAENALNDNERYKVVWQILNALRTHDERLDQTINKIGLGEDVSDRIEIIGITAEQELEATTAVVEDVKKKNTKNKDPINSDSPEPDHDTGQEQMSFILSDLSQAIKAKIVEKCGTRDYWENWAKDIAIIARQQVERINGILINPDSKERKAFNSFLEEIRDDLNPDITESDAIEMLAQHLITKPVFDTLFIGNKFTKENNVSKAMEKVLEYLQATNIDTETKSLEKFYSSVKRRAAGIITPKGRQTLVYELYHRFFRTAFPTMSQKLGIVYTPVEIVDFIIYSINDLLSQEFGQTIGNNGVHILDPFTGTGTFITRLLQSGLIQKNELECKYLEEIHANEIVLLAYYIAAINIEAIYHDLAGENVPYTQFEGICLTDTFQMHEQEKDGIAVLLPDNSERRTLQKSLDIRVIMGNPPYSSGQRNVDDNAENYFYKKLDNRISDTYAKHSKAKLKTALYDSYIRAFRWSTDLIKDNGIIAFVSNAGWLDGSAMDGMRKSLREEFSKIYIFNLRGDARTSGEHRKKEKGNVFGAGTRTPIAITILVKNERIKEKGKIYYYDIGDYLSEKEKLKEIHKLHSLEGIASLKKWKIINNNKSHDWLKEGDPSFKKHIIMGNREEGSFSIFSKYSGGMKTNRDKWTHNASHILLEKNMSKTISFYNTQANTLKGKELKHIKNKVIYDKTKISWSDKLLKGVKRGLIEEFKQEAIRTTMYRPFEKCYLYYSDLFNERPGIAGDMFPDDQSYNRVICVSGIGHRGYFSTLMAKHIPNYNYSDMDNCQCFPLKIYSNQNGKIEMTDGISDEGLNHFRDKANDQKITKEELFYYIYGILHSETYRKRFKNDLSKELPRIPAVKNKNTFNTFSEAGRRLSELHINYDSVNPYKINFKQGDIRLSNVDMPEEFYKVKKMKFLKKDDKSVVIYNNNLTIVGIPLEAYEYMVNGRPALEWVMERQCIKPDKPTGIINDANAYANETIRNPAYPLELFQKVITVSIETMKIVKSLPNLIL